MAHLKWMPEHRAREVEASAAALEVELGILPKREE